jgi:hypothetical protein
MADGYNGWKNKETWLVNLWLGDTLSSDQEEGITVDANYIEQMVEEMAENAREGSGGFITDLLNCALGAIDYEELAEHYKEDQE